MRARWLVYAGILGAGLWFLQRRGAILPLPSVRPAEGVNWSDTETLRTLIRNLLNAIQNPPNSKESQVMWFFPEIERAAAHNRVDPALVAAIIDKESEGDPDARGPIGEYGLMQIRASTAQMISFTGDPARLLDPATNIEYGAKYLRWQLDRYRDQMLRHEWAVAAYHAGTAYKRGGEFVNVSGNSIQKYVDDIVKDRWPRYLYLFKQVYRQFGEPPRGAFGGLGLWRCSLC